MLNTLIKFTKRLLFGYEVKLPDKDFREKVHEIAEKGGSWEDFL